MTTERSRPCIRTGMFVDGQLEPRTWCGRDATGQFAFVDAGHAALTVRNQGSFLPCRACSLQLAQLFQGVAGATEGSS